MTPERYRSVHVLVEPKPRKRVFAPIVLALVLAGFGVLGWQVHSVLQDPIDPLEQKTAAAERYLYYRITQTKGPRFKLTGEEEVLRFVSHAVAPSGLPYDPIFEVEYGLRFEIFAGGKSLWSHSIYTRSRQSKARPYLQTWLDENAFSLESKLELTDDRIMIVPMPPEIPAGAELQLTLIGATDGAVRGYMQTARSELLKELRLEVMAPADRQRFAERSSFEPWDRLPEAARNAVLRSVQHRLSAMGKEDDDYETRVIYTSGFRLPPAPPIELVAPGVMVSALRSAAVNVTGPAVLTLRANRAPPVVPIPGMPVPPVETGPAKVTAAIVHDAEVVPPPIAFEAPGFTKLAIPAGTVTLTLATTSVTGVVVELTAPEGTNVAFGTLVPPLVPEEQVIPGYLANAQTPVIAAIEGPDDLLARTLRVDVRPLADASVPLLTPITAKLTLETADAQGKVIATTTAEVATIRAQFEQLQLFAKQTAPIAEPIGFRFIVPPGGKQLRVRSDKPAMVQFYSPIEMSPPFDELDVPFKDVIALTTMWRYARYADRGWLPLRAANHLALTPERTVKLAAYTRLEKRIIPPEIEADAVNPEGRPDRQVAIERLDAVRARQSWEPGFYLRLEPGQATRVDFSKSPAQPEIQYWAPEAMLGKTIDIAIDGDPVDSHRVTATRGRIKLPGLSGVHAVSASGAAGSRLLIDRPPVTWRGELYAMRTVFRMDKTLRLRVNKRSKEPVNLDIMVYARGAGPRPGVMFHATIDGGKPERIAGVALQQWTLAERHLPLEASQKDAIAGFAGVGDRGKLYPRLFVVSLGDDLPNGTHTVDVRISGDREVWGRIFTLSAGKAEVPRALQWRDVDAGGD
jgi:hypothetical protein